MACNVTVTSTASIQYKDFVVGGYPDSSSEKLKHWYVYYYSVPANLSTFTQLNGYKPYKSYTVVGNATAFTSAKVVPTTLNDTTKSNYTFDNTQTGTYMRFKNNTTLRMKNRDSGSVILKTTGFYYPSFPALPTKETSGYSVNRDSWKIYYARS